MPPLHPMSAAIGVRTSETLARDLKEVVEAALANVGEFDVGLGEIEEFVTTLVRESSNQFKDKFLGNVIEQNMLQPHNSHDGELVLLPDGVRLFYSGAKTAIAVVEQKPQVRTLMFDQKYEDVKPVNPSKTKRAYRLALPYIVWMFRWSMDGSRYRFEYLFMTYRTEPLRGLNDTLYWPNLPNISAGTEDGSNAHPIVCMGSSFQDTTRGSVLDQAGQVLQHYWSSPYNDDLPVNFWNGTKLDKRIKTLPEWEKSTKQDPLFPLQVKWRKYATLADLIRFTTQELQGIKLPVSDTNVVAQRVYNKAWQQATAAGRLTENTRAARKALTAKFEDAMTTFASELAANLDAVGNETLRRTVQVAVQAALKKSLKKVGGKK